MKKICAIGGGRWGQNHIKTLYGMGALAAIVESRKERLEELLSIYPGVKGYTSVDEAIAARYDGYTVATPAETHFAIGKKLIEAGLPVMLEKPMTFTVAESEELCRLSDEKSVPVMVGHVLLFHPAIRKIKELVDGGKLGKLYYIYSNRLNLGTVRTHESVFSSFAPHDISVLDYLIGSSAVKVSASGGKFLQDKVFDTTLSLFEYPNNVKAHIFVSWLHPFKQQLLVVVGSKGMVSFDDSTSEKEIHFYNKSIEFEAGNPVKLEQPDEVVPYQKKMPLEEELRYFIDNLDRGFAINTAKAGYEVVKVLEEVQRQIER